MKEIEIIDNSSKTESRFILIANNIAFDVDEAGK
jgi:hypothetical protein